MVAIALIAGLISGPFLPEAARDAHHPTTWSDVALMLLMATVFVVLMIVFLALKRNWRGMRGTSTIMVVCGIFFAASGICAGLIATNQGSGDPDAFISGAVGIGILLGAGICKMVFPNARGP